MLSTEKNLLLTQTGPGTPMGAMFRSFWLPALLSKELESDGSPKRLRILSEDLVAFRDTKGKVGIIDAFCPHKLVNLYFGRNEECGLRCANHGWKFDVDGNCVDLPNVPQDTPNLAGVRKNLKITSYPTQERAGLVWVYMGAVSPPPPLPELEYLDLPEGHVHVSRWLQRTNWASGLEGEMDSSHISFLHRGNARPEDTIVRNHGQLHSEGASGDGAPVIELKETDYGFVYGAKRVVRGKNYWRVTHFLLPTHSLVPRVTDEMMADEWNKFIGGGRIWVPVDDGHVTTYAVRFRVDRPYTREEIAAIESGVGFPPRVTPGMFKLADGPIIDTFLPVANKDNDYLIDRELQRNGNFSGIAGVNEQDRAMQESMRQEPGHPGIVDRSKEHLVASDKAGILLRRVLLAAAEKAAGGQPIKAAENPSVYGVRAIGRLTEIDKFDQLMKQDGKFMRAPSPKKKREPEKADA